VTTQDEFGNSATATASREISVDLGDDDPGTDSVIDYFAATAIGEGGARITIKVTDFPQDFDMSHMPEFLDAVRDYFRVEEGVRLSSHVVKSEGEFYTASGVPTTVPPAFELDENGDVADSSATNFTFEDFIALLDGYTSPVALGGDSELVTDDLDSDEFEPAGLMMEDEPLIISDAFISTAEQTEADETGTDFTSETILLEDLFPEINTESLEQLLQLVSNEQGEAVLQLTDLNSGELTSVVVAELDYQQVIEHFGSAEQAVETWLEFGQLIMDPT
ncbi:hypothetical protein Q3O59_11730, partial [Alkalimonas delamerensis]